LEFPVLQSEYKVLFITDSLAFPRAEPEFVSYEETYLCLLKNEFPDCDFIHQGRGGATIVDLYKHSAYFHETLQADLVFVQSGIVDCAPRALTVIEQQVISRIPVMKALFLGMIKKYSHVLRRVRNMTYTPLPAFRSYVSQFERLFPNVHWIGILPATEAYDAQVNGIRRNVAVYNAVLQEHRYVDTADFDANSIMSDHHHLNRVGHQKMYEKLAAIIRSNLSLRVEAGAADAKDSARVPGADTDRLSNAPDSVPSHSEFAAGAALSA
jgi:hypothetical protein